MRHARASPVNCEAGGGSFAAPDFSIAAAAKASDARSAWGKMRAAQEGFGRLADADRAIRFGG